MHSEYAINEDVHLQGSCMINTNNFNRSCINHKIEHLLRKLPSISGWSSFKVNDYLSKFRKNKIK